MRRLLTVLLFIPCFGMCGLVAAQQAFSHREARRLEGVGERYLAALDGGQAPAPPDHFTYRPLDDGGFVFYFAEPSFPMPTDYFFVWDRGDKRWVRLEASELP